MNRRSFIGLSFGAAGFAAGFIPDGYAASPSGKSKIIPAADLSGLEYEGESIFQELNSMGFRSILAGQSLKQAFAGRPADLAALLKKNNIRVWILDAGIFPCHGFSSADFSRQADEIILFAKSAGAGYLLFSAEKRTSYPPGKDKMLQLAAGLDEFAGKAKKAGLKILLQNAMHSICQTESEFAQVLLAVKARNVEILADPAMGLQAGANPSVFLENNKKKIACIRFNDITRPVKGFAGSRERNYRIELPGNGNALNYAELAAVVAKFRFRGFGIAGNCPEHASQKDCITAAASAMQFLKQQGIL
jgi:sugar phosphate isomerase/epimerase